MDDTERARLKAKLDSLQTAIIVLFLASIAALGAHWLVPGLRNRFTFFLCPAPLGVALVVRVYRIWVARKYKA